MLAKEEHSLVAEMKMRLFLGSVAVIRKSKNNNFWHIFHGVVL